MGRIHLVASSQRTLPTSPPKARELVKVGRVSLALVVRTMLLVGVVEGVEVVVVDVIAVKDIGDELEE